MQNSIDNLHKVEPMTILDNNVVSKPLVHFVIPYGWGKYQKISPIFRFLQPPLKILLVINKLWYCIPILGVIDLYSSSVIENTSRLLLCEFGKIPTRLYFVHVYDVMVVNKIWIMS